MPGGNPYHDDTGRFTTGGGVALEKSNERAFAGRQVETITQLSKLETGSLGEEIAVAYFRDHVGIKDVRSINVGRNNAPVDAVGDHTAIEIKTGLVSNSKSAQQWRATIGQPGKEETEWLRKASREEKATWNEKKAQAILDRKIAALKELSKELGVNMKPKTVGVIIHADRRKADIYVFDGFHHRIGWTSDLAKKSYVGTYSYA
jgi:hypothetical protein